MEFQKLMVINDHVHYEVSEREVYVLELTLKSGEVEILGIPPQCLNDGKVCTLNRLYQDDNSAWHLSTIACDHWLGGHQAFVKGEALKRGESVEGFRGQLRLARCPAERES